LETNRKYLERRVRKSPRPDQPRQELDCIHALDLEDRHHILVNKQTW